MNLSAHIPSESQLDEKRFDRKTEKEIEKETDKDTSSASAAPGVVLPAATWKTALLVCGSALLGATAVALWNRRMVTKLQQQSPANRPHSATNLAPHLDVKEFF